MSRGEDRGEEPSNGSCDAKRTTVLHLGDSSSAPLPFHPLGSNAPSRNHTSMSHDDANSSSAAPCPSEALLDGEGSAELSLFLEGLEARLSSPVFSTIEPLKEFTKFRKFPKEIRLKIWAVLLTQARVFKVQGRATQPWRTPRYNGFGEYELDDPDVECDHSEWELSRHSRMPPIVLHICHESRGVFGCRNSIGQEEGKKLLNLGKFWLKPLGNFAYSPRPLYFRLLEASFIFVDKGIGT